MCVQVWSAEDTQDGAAKVALKIVQQKEYFEAEVLARYNGGSTLDGDFVLDLSHTHVPTEMLAEFGDTSGLIFRIRLDCDTSMCFSRCGL